MQKQHQQSLDKLRRATQSLVETRTALAHRQRGIDEAAEGQYNRLRGKIEKQAKAVEGVQFGNATAGQQYIGLLNERRALLTGPLADRDTAADYAADDANLVPQIADAPHASAAMLAYTNGPSPEFLAFWKNRNAK